MTVAEPLCLHQYCPGAGLVVGIYSYMPLLLVLGLLFTNGGNTENYAGARCCQWLLARLWHVSAS